MKIELIGLVGGRLVAFVPVMVALPEQGISANTSKLDWQISDATSERDQFATIDPLDAGRHVTAREIHAGTLENRAVRGEPVELLTMPICTSANVEASVLDGWPACRSSRGHAASNLRGLSCKIGTSPAGAQTSGAPYSYYGLNLSDTVRSS